ncbi:flippase [Vibrio ziniensis]|uniref:Flippase n=1 Tax=Vibrio ziniensis TaxID=2711221 RepID=A0A6G7CLI7_9VIBR|nr:flippase [Vibrio ziniensis]QIH42975.1 flippase [Vibrio ziniensis]
MLDKTIIKNISSLFSIRVAGYIIPLITLPYLVRTLEPIGYGTLTFCIAIVQYFVIFVNYGFDLSATQKIAQNKDDKFKLSKIYWNVIAARLLLTLIGLIIIFVLKFMFESISDMSIVLFSAYFSVLGAALFPQWLFQGKEQLGTISIIRLFLQVLIIPLFFLFVKSAEDVWVAALINSIPSLMIVVFSFSLISKRKWISWHKPTVNGVLSELNDGWYLFLSSAAKSLYTTSTTVVLGLLSGPISVGIYASANKLLQAAQGLYTPISASFYPRINSLMVNSQLDAMNMIKYLMKLQFSLTLSIGISMYIFAPFVIDILFGEGYAESISVLRIMSVLPIVIGLSNIFGVQILLTHGYKKEFTKILILSGVISLFTLLPLCFYFDYIGAALSVVITEIMVTAFMWLVIKIKKIPNF